VLKLDVFQKPDRGSNWLLSLGAALRGLTPRNQDGSISLMPVSTKQAYEYQRAISFASFLSKLSIAVALFFVVCYASAWGFLVSVQQKTIDRIDNLSELPVSDTAAADEERAQKLNGLISTSAAIIKTTPAWSKVIDELAQKTDTGIIVTGLSLPAPEGTMTVTGVAANRVVLNDFKKRLEESTLFANIKLPLTNLEQKEKIPFSVSLNLKDPASLYPQ
jgi:Tfp pilus assembly protein PilN